MESLEDLIYNFYKAYHKVEQLKLDSTIKCLTQNEIYIIRSIADKTLTINELNEKLDTTLGTTSSAINKLEKKRFVKREKDNIDKRKVYVSLTKKGLIAYEIYDSFHKELILKITKNIKKEDLEKYYETFSIMKNNLLEIQKEFRLIDLFSLEVNDVAVISEIKLSYAAFKYVYEKGMIQGKEIKILEKSKNVLKLETFKGIKIITEEDAKGIYCVKKEEK